VASDIITSDQDLNRKQPSTRVKPALPEFAQTEDDFIVSDMSDEGAEDDAVEVVQNRASPAPLTRNRSKNIREVGPDEDYGGALLNDAERKLLHKLKANQRNVIKPVVRKPFPEIFRDRSPIYGASNTTVLRTCFRIGEALNVGCQAVRENKNVLLELHARVTKSWREPKPGRHQHFVLHDLYHDKPPHLHGTFALYDQSPLWNMDSRHFLGIQNQGRICRLIGKMKRHGPTWKIDILSIWAATWEDVDYVAGIYAKDNNLASR
jgi:hypothetical protein